MTFIVSYQKHVDAFCNRELRLPQDARAQFLGTELATIDGTTYVALPDGAALPADQPAEIASSIAVVTLDPVLREQIKAASPHCKLIAQRMIEQIRAAYSLDDEMYFARIGVGAATGMYQPSAGEMADMQAFGELVESVRQWGRQQRVELGL